MSDENKSEAKQKSADLAVFADMQLQTLLKRGIWGRHVS